MQVQEKEEYFPLNMSKVYKGLITDYSWYVQFQEEFLASDTGIHYRDTVIDYFRSLDDLSNYAFEEKYSIYIPESSSTSQITTTAVSTSIENTVTSTIPFPTTTITTSGFHVFIVLSMMAVVVLLKKRFT